MLTGASCPMWVFAVVIYYTEHFWVLDCFEAFYKHSHFWLVGETIGRLITAKTDNVRNVKGVKPCSIHVYNSEYYIILNQCQPLCLQSGQFSLNENVTLQMQNVLSQLKPFVSAICYLSMENICIAKNFTSKYA